MPIEPNMGLDLPDTSTAGPDYVTKNTTAFETIGEHDHSSGKGVQITPAGININTDLEFNSNDAIELRSARFDNNGAVLADASDDNCVYVYGGDLYYNNSLGTSIQITDGNNLNITAAGTIGGDYKQSGITADVTYTDATKVFAFTQDTGITAKVALGDILLYENILSANAVTIKSPTSLAAPITITMPSATGTLCDLENAQTISGTKTVSGTLTSSGGTLSGTWAGAPTFSGGPTLTDPALSGATCSFAVDTTTALTLDYTNYQVCSRSISGDKTYTLSGLSTGGVYYAHITSTGDYDITWSHATATFIWDGTDSAYIHPNSGSVMYQFYYDGSNIWASVISDNKSCGVSTNTATNGMGVTIVLGTATGTIGQWRFNWVRKGNLVTVNGWVAFTCTGTGTLDIEIDIPIKYNQDCVGTMTGDKYNGIYTTDMRPMTTKNNTTVYNTFNHYGVTGTTMYYGCAFTYLLRDV